MHDGLVANPVRCIYQDSKGFIWIGTVEGLSRYDGYKFRNYTTTNGLSHNFINSMIEVDGNLLIAENNGAIDVIRNNSIRKTYMARSAVNAATLYQDRLLLSTDANGFYEYKNDTIILPAQEKVNSFLGHFLPFRDSFLVVDGVNNSFIIFKGDLKVHSLSKNFGGHIYSLFGDSKKRIWACSSKGLKLFQFSTGQNTISAARLPAPFDIPLLNKAQVTSMIEEADGGYWIGTMKGLVRISPSGNFHVYTEKEGLPSAIINTLYRDKENNLWVGTALGLGKWVSKNNVVFYNSGDKEFRNDVGSIYYLGDNKMILGTQHGLQQFNLVTKEFSVIRGAAKQYPVPVQGSFPLLVYSPYEIGMADTTKNLIIPVKKLDADIQDVIVSVMHPDGTIFLGTFGGLLALKKNSLVNVLPHRITSIVIDSNNNIWAGTWFNGLFRITRKENTDAAYDVEDITPVIKEKTVRGLYSDSKKNLWVGTRYAGAFCLTEKPDKKLAVQHFNRQSGLMSDWVSCFAETNAGDIWIGSYLGLDKLVKEPSGYRVFNFSKAVNFFAELKKIVPGGNNDWVCLANTGIAYFKDENLDKTMPLQASILSASLGVLENKVTIVLPHKKISLRPHQNAARFEFSSLGFINERQIMYSYRLKGSSDTTWSRPENVHEASYASLSPGNYTFEVKTIGWNGEHGIPAAFSFHISTPFWKQWWFVALGFLVVIVLLYGLYRYRIMQLVRLQNVRNSIATDLHDDIGSSLTNISILSELGTKNLSQPEKAQPFLQRISEEVHASSQAMDDIIWSVNSHNDSLQEALARMRRYAAELFDNSETNCHLQLDENSANKKLSMDQRRDVYLIYKEALNNIHKHARASNVWIEVTQNQNYLRLQVRDDGKGFHTDVVTHRNGLKNLRSRVEKWNGKIKIESEESKGTFIDIKLPLKD